jgi:hypothetical protein
MPLADAIAVMLGSALAGSTPSRRSRINNTFHGFTARGSPLSRREDKGQSRSNHKPASRRGMEARDRLVLCFGAAGRAPFVGLLRQTRGRRTPVVVSVSSASSIVMPAGRDVHEGAPPDRIALGAEAVGSHAEAAATHALTLTPDQQAHAVTQQAHVATQQAHAATQEAHAVEQEAHAAKQEAHATTPFAAIVVAAQLVRLRKLHLTATQAAADARAAAAVATEALKAKRQAHAATQYM